MTDAVHALLRSTPIFRLLKPDDRARLADVTLSRRYARGDVVFEEGAPSEFFYTVVTGRVKVTKSMPSGKDVILEVFGPGDPFGAVAVYEDRPFPASAISLEDTTCLLIPRREFFALLENHPTLVRGLLFGLTHRLLELTARLAELTGGRVEPRVARLFLKLADERGHGDGPDVFIPMPLSRQELADLTGTTIETAIRIMSRWNKQRIVITEKEGFRLVDRQALEVLAMN